MRAEFLRAWLEVDLSALVRNARAVQRHARAPLLAMVKADAYGLGVRSVVPALETIAPWGYGVATADEGAELRALGISRPVVVFDPLMAEELPQAQAHSLSPTLADGALIARWAQATGNAPWHLAVDTGMSRTGVRWTHVAALRTVLAAYPPAGVCTHFHSADTDPDVTALQATRFRSALDALPARPPLVHAENSPAIERLDAPSSWNLVRPGVFLYGVGSRDGEDAPLMSEPVAALRARIAELRWIEAGDTVSYGATFRATARRRIATVAAGYADGYRRAFSNVGHGLLHGQRVPVAGIVTMDMTMLDVTGVDCAVGDVITLLGRDLETATSKPATIVHPADGATIGVAAAAQTAGLCAYELLTGFRLRLRRVYVGPSPE